MKFRVSNGHLISFCLLVSGNLIWAKTLENEDKSEVGSNETMREENTTTVVAPVEQTSTTNEFSPNQITSESVNIAEASRKLMLSVVDVNPSTSSSDTSGFKPSVHLGEIEEPRRTKTNPFNKVQDVKFDNGVDLPSHRGQLGNFRLGVQPYVHRYAEQTQPEQVPASDIQNQPDELQQSGRITFRDNVSEIPKFPYENVLNDPSLVAVQHAAIDTDSRYELPNHQEHQLVPENLEKPTKLQTIPYKYDLGSSSGFDVSRPQYLGGFHDYHNYQPALYEYEVTKKPDNSVVYLQESSFTRTRKFPYPYYQPQVGYREIEFPTNAHPVAPYPRRSSILPWKKILHLIGAVLPFGLLLATLTPNVVKIADNTTQPNIVLSKLRVADLPVEHKQARVTNVESRDDCEERSICESILAGSKAGSNVWQTILWNLATGPPEIIGSGKELRRIFEAAKKEDCSTIAC